VVPEWPWSRACRGGNRGSAGTHLAGVVELLADTVNKSPSKVMSAGCGARETFRTPPLRALDHGVSRRTRAFPGSQPPAHELFTGRGRWEAKVPAGEGFLVRRGVRCPAGGAMAGGGTRARRRVERPASLGRGGGDCGPHRHPRLPRRGLAAGGQLDRRRGHVAGPYAQRLRRGVRRRGGPGGERCAGAGVRPAAARAVAGAGVRADGRRRGAGGDERGRTRRLRPRPRRAHDPGDAAVGARGGPGRVRARTRGDAPGPRAARAARARGRPVGARGSPPPARLRRPDRGGDRSRAGPSGDPARRLRAPARPGKRRDHLRHARRVRRPPARPGGDRRGDAGRVRRGRRGGRGRRGDRARRDLDGRRHDLRLSGARQLRRRRGANPPASRSGRRAASTSRSGARPVPHR
jgi:hypothetical protein